MKNYISVDVGGTNIRIGLLKLTQQKPSLTDLVTLPILPDFTDAKKIIPQKIKEVIPSLTSIKGISFALPGPVDTETLFDANNLRGWERQPIRGEFEKEFSLPVKLVHDATASALGEAFYGAGTELSEFLYFTWGTGFGGVGLIKGEKVKIHYLEPAHQLKEWRGLQCTCGQQGCFEAYLGGWALDQKYNIPQLPDDHPIWDQVAQDAAQMLVNIMMLHPKKNFIFGGGLITKRKFLLAKIHSLMKSNLSFYEVPTFIPADLGEHAALFGGVAIFENKINLN